MVMMIGKIQQIVTLVLQQHSGWINSLLHDKMREHEIGTKNVGKNQKWKKQHTMHTTHMLILFTQKVETHNDDDMKNLANLYTNVWTA